MGNYALEIWIYQLSFSQGIIMFVSIYIRYESQVSYISQGEYSQTFILTFIVWQTLCELTYKFSFKLLTSRGFLLQLHSLFLLKRFRAVLIWWKKSEKKFSINTLTNLLSKNILFLVRGFTYHEQCPTNQNHLKQKLVKLKVSTLK